MEKSISAEERIKRAEEIYARRRNSNRRSSVATVNVNEKKNLSLFKKIFIQMLICLLIYSIFYLINTTNYVFSEDVKSYTRDVLSYDIDLENIFNEIGKAFNGFMNNQSQQIVLQENKIDEQNNIEENVNQIEEQNNQIGQDNIEEDQEKVELSQEEQDAKYIKENFNLIVPLEGTISSEFGEREVNNPVITPEHYGIDIAQEEGSDIVAAMEGEVIVSNYSSSFGNFIEIQNQNLITIYAHCSSLLVNEGDQVGQGDIIAKVGSTGAATGPHLHFEIRLDDRRINPRTILDF